MRDPGNHDFIVQKWGTCYRMTFKPAATHYCIGFVNGQMQIMSVYPPEPSGDVSTYEFHKIEAFAKRLAELAIDGRD